MMTPSRLLPLCVGLALGAAGARVFRPAPPASATPGRPSETTIINLQSLIINNQLPPAEAAEALAAWLALGAPSDSSAPADFATQADALRALLTLLPDESFAHLLDALVTRSGPDAERLRQLAFDVWVERSPATAAHWAAALVPSDLLDERARNRLCAQAALAWGQLDFDAAYAWTQTLGDAQLLRHLGSRLLVQLAATEPARALALAQAQPNPLVLEYAHRELFQTWAKSDPAAAVRALGPALLEKYSGEVQSAAAAWLAADPRAALAWANENTKTSPDGLGNEFVFSLIQRALISPGDHRPLADVLADPANTTNQTTNLYYLLGSWVPADPAAALAWLNTLPDAAQRHDLIDRLIPDGRMPGFTKPETYLPFALDLPPGKIRDEKLAGLLEAWTRTDPDAALQWLRQHDEPTFAPAAARAESALLGVLAANDPAAALARWQSLSPGEIKTSSLAGIARGWAATDPAAAARWLGQHLPPTPESFAETASMMSELRGRGLGVSGDPTLISLYNTLADTAFVWGKKAPLDALRWAEALPDPIQQTTALRALAGTYGEARDRGAHADLLARLTDRKVRSQHLTEHLRNWLRADLPSARAWIETHDALSPERAADLLATP